MYYGDYSNFAPHSGQNFGTGFEESGLYPHLGHAETAFALPHSEQNLPVLCAPHEQIHSLLSGFAFPHSAQNFPVFFFPQEQTHSFADAAPVF